MEKVQRAFRIEKNVPIPKPSRRRGRPPVYPLEDMKVGESFFVKAATAGQRQKVRPLIYGSIKRVERDSPNRKYELRSFDDGVRVWRTK